MAGFRHSWGFRYDTGMTTYDLDWVRQHYLNGKNPRVHPNGFVQLDLAEVAGGWHESHQQGHSGAALRLHIWNPPDHELPHQETVNEIHDHVFDMRSHVVRGTLEQRLYHLIVGGDNGNTHQIYRAVYGKGADSRLEATGIVGRLHEYDRYPIGQGFPYTQPAFTFHDSVAHGTVVTVMEKQTIREGNASVLCHIGMEPDNSFDRASAAPASFLWSAITASLA